MSNFDTSDQFGLKCTILDTSILENAIKYDLDANFEEI